MPETEIITLQAAAKIAGVTRQAVQKWCSKYGIGRQLPNRRWIISEAGLRRVIKSRSKVRAIMDALDPVETDYDHHDR